MLPTDNHPGNAKDGASDDLSIRGWGCATTTGGPTPRAKDLFVATKEETPATRGYVLAGVRSLCVVGTSHIVGRSDQVVALIAA